MEQERKTLFEDLARAVQDFDEERAMGLAEDAYRSGASVAEIVEAGLSPGIRAIGERFERGEAFLPELIMGANVVKEVMGKLLPRAASGDALGASGTVVLATVVGDIHDIGKNIVGAMLTAAGFRVVDLGVDVPSERIVQSAESEGADIIALSALLTTTLAGQREVIELLRARGVRDKYLVIIGGAAATEQWAREIGADGFGSNANEAVRLARKLVGKE